MEKRLARGDKGINPLDAACREHDIAYANNKDSAERYKADLKLKSAANTRILAKDASFGERAAAAAVSAAMKVKTGISRIGSGLRKRLGRKKKTTCRKRKEIAFKQLVSRVRSGVKKAKPRTLQGAVKAAIGVARKLRSGKRITKIPRIIKVPSISGGLLPILPVLSGLAAAGTIANTVVNIIKTLGAMKKPNGVNKKLGAGLYLAPQKQGRGLYLKTFPKN